MTTKLTLLIVVYACLIAVSATLTNTGTSIQSLLKGIPPYGGGGGCPLCDTSVYSYCSNKLYHDACCCNGGGGVPGGGFGGIGGFGGGPGLGAFGGNPGIGGIGGIGGYGYNCPATNCAYLHANTCYEHSLILSCCCNNPYRK